MLNNWDHQLFLFLNGLHVGWLDPVMTFISSELGWIPFYAVLVFLVFYKYKWKGLGVLLGVAVAITFSDQIASHLFKPMVMRLRPCHDPLTKDLVYLPDGHCGGLYGFMSSHASNTFALASLIYMTMKKHYSKIGWVMFPWAAVVSYSRIYMGAHFPGDVICGAALGVLLGFGIGYLTRFVISSAAKRNREISNNG
ncbi:MAG: phosphatase PAP2 family protein [Bacteroidales bacterium]|nr:phosphatase PAP2 family protein [Bacteroidales bacterium]